MSKEVKPLTAEELKDVRCYWANVRGAASITARLLATIDALTARAQAAEEQLSVAQKFLTGRMEKLRDLTAERDRLAEQVRVWRITVEGTALTLERRDRLLTEAQEEVCSALCPNVKRTGEDWTHSELCAAITKEMSMPPRAALADQPPEMLDDGVDDKRAVQYLKDNEDALLQEAKELHDYMAQTRADQPKGGTDGQ